MRKLHNLMVFYVDVGNTPEEKIEEYMANVKRKLFPKPSYIDDQYFIPVRGGQGTHIEVLTVETSE